MKWNLRNKFLLPTLILVLIGLSILTIVSYFESKDVIEKMAKSQINELSLSTAKQLDTWINDIRLDISSWSGELIFKTAVQDTFLGEASRDTASDKLAVIKNNYRHFDYLALAGTDGKCLAASNLDLIEKLNVSGRNFFEKSVKGELAVSEVRKSELSGKPIFFVSAPVQHHGKSSGVLMGAVSMEYYSKEFIEPIKVGITGYAYIYNKEGYIIAYKDKKLILNFNIKSFDPEQKMIKNENGMIRYTYNNSIRIAGYQKVEIADWFVAVAADTNELFAPAKKLGVILLILGVIIITLVGIVVFFIAQSVSRPLNQMMDTLRQGGNDLTLRLNVGSKDEVGELAGWFNQFIENLQLIINRIAEKSKTLGLSSQDLLNLSKKLSSGSKDMSQWTNSVSSTTEEMSSNINTMASSVEEMSVNIQSVSDNAGKMSNNMNFVADSIENMTNAITNIANNAREGSNISHEAIKLSDSASEKMNTLGDAARGIGEITEVIKRIAEQTNLLALNATIEAASAGDAGKGFAVVANEIKELANQSAGAAEDIAERIAGVQENTSEAVRSIADVSAIINTINNSVQGITESVDSQMKAAHEISNNIQQTSIGADKIALSIAEIATGANDMAKNAGEAAKGAVDVAFNINSLSKAAEAANIDSQKINESSVNLDEIARQFHEMVGRFKNE